VTAAEIGQNPLKITKKLVRVLHVEGIIIMLARVFKYGKFEMFAIKLKTA
jgi:hypothetical protein